MQEADSITTIPLIGGKYSKLLKNLEIKTVGDLLGHYPSRYVDFSTRSTTSDIQPGEVVTISGIISSFVFRPTRKRGFTIQEAVLNDVTGSIKLLWFNQAYLRTVFAKGVNVSVAGTVEEENGKLFIKNPDYEILRGRSLEFQGPSSTNTIHTGRIVPIYPETQGISSKWLRSKTALITGLLDWYQYKYNIMPSLSEWLPDTVLQKEKLISIQEAYREIHFPSSFETLEQAKKRLAFDELLTQQLISQYRRKRWQEEEKAKKINVNQTDIQNFIDNLPFQLTNDQQKATSEILKDLSNLTAMNRLLQGDVGSGKTVVAALASAAVIRAGYQVALMVPTQVLADQHAETLTALLKPFGFNIALLTGSVRGVTRSGETRRAPAGSLRARMSDGAAARQDPDLLIGTHALLHDRAKSLIDKDRLALVIIDEQHRFGVTQRTQLVESGVSPHVLSMTATPIPRTIALTMYGNLDISFLQTMPQGRIPVKTWVVPESKRQASYQWMKEQMKQGHQIFVVCPLIEESDHESLQNIKASTVEFEKLKKIFPGFRLALLHGNIPGNKKSLILSQMKEKQIDLLITTPVIEVGVDIPGATIMVVEGADRFGLAQLHQLRGRVGRRSEQSFCLLFPTSPKLYKRLRALETIHNGLELATLDLKLRGPGHLFSTEQHGWPQFKIADTTDEHAVRHAYIRACSLMDQLDKYPVIREKLMRLDKLIAPN